uniref:Uncharacterized protein n=1 Tax=Trichobilharzia regenti TaxID=157069 RepID=A0AA85J3S6_TRIRE|nr:unnamed protein product [Trichobilharzia regenti]
MVKKHILYKFTYQIYSGSVSVKKTFNQSNSVHRKSNLSEISKCILTHVHKKLYYKVHCLFALNDSTDDDHDFIGGKHNNAKEFVLFLYLYTAYSHVNWSDHHSSIDSCSRIPNIFEVNYIAAMSDTANTIFSVLMGLSLVVALYLNGQSLKLCDDTMAKSFLPVRLALTTWSLVALLYLSISIAIQLEH